MKERYTQTEIIKALKDTLFDFNVIPHETFGRIMEKNRYVLSEKTVYKDIPEFDEHPYSVKEKFAYHLYNAHAQMPQAELMDLLMRTLKELNPSTGQPAEYHFGLIAMNSLPLRENMLSYVIRNHFQEWGSIDISTVEIMTVMNEIKSGKSTYPSLKDSTVYKDTDSYGGGLR